MTGAPAPALRVVIAGAGVAGLECALTLEEVARDRVDVTLVDPADRYEERAWAPAEVLAPASHPAVPLAEVLADTGVELRRDALVAVDAPAHAAALQSGRRLPYDVLVVAVGAQAAAVPRGAIRFDPADLAPVRRLAGALSAGAVRRLAIVVPPGRHWSLPAYELAMLLARHARDHGRPADVVVVAPEPRPLSIFGPAAPGALLEALDDAGVRLLAGTVCEVRSGDRTQLILHPGHTHVDVDAVVALPPLRPRAVAGLGSDGHDFLRVDRAGRLDGTPDVYAIGDAANRPLKLGALAAQQAEAAAYDIAARAGAEPSLPFPRHELPALLLTGDDARPLGAAALGTVAVARRAAKVQAPRLARRLEALRSP